MNHGSSDPGDPPAGTTDAHERPEEQPDAASDAASDAAGDPGEAPGIDKDKPLYVISVAAELVDMHPQTLRLYERKGLIEPSRSAGKTRLYSQRNIEQLREIRRLTQELGVNLAGVEEIIKLREKLDELQHNMEHRITRLQGQLQGHMRAIRGELPAAPDAPPDASDAPDAAENPSENPSGNDT